jgi:putative serine protease PepD
MSEPTPRYPGLVPDEPPPPPEQAAPQPVAVPRNRRNRSTPRIGGVIGTLAGGIIGAALTVGALFAFGVLPGTNQTTPSITTLPRLASVSETVPTDAVTAIANGAIPSIVTVEVGDGDGRIDLATASGSGVVYTSDGYILTNNHVVDGAGFVRVILADGRVYQASVVGADFLTDVAVISIDAPDLKPLPLANPDDLQIGDLAVAIGNPLGLSGGPSVTSGIISAFDRQLQVTADEQLFGLLQTDAPITRGSSGGALLDANGELIGITTAIGLSDVGAEGLGFAVPVSIVQGVANDLIRDGVVHHAFIGVEVQPAFIDQGNAQVPEGAEIISFLGDTGIQDSGAQVGDVIAAINGHSVKGTDDLIAILRTMRAGQTVTLTLLRKGEQIDVSAQLAQRPDQP